MEHQTIFWHYPFPRDTTWTSSVDTWLALRTLFHMFRSVSFLMKLWMASNAPPSESCSCSMTKISFVLITWPDWSCTKYSESFSSHSSLEKETTGPFQFYHPLVRYLKNWFITNYMIFWINTTFCIDISLVLGKSTQQNKPFLRLLTPSKGN